MMSEVNEKAVATGDDSKNAPMDPTTATDLAESAIEKALVRKVDMHIIPLIILLYLFSFLDRGMSGFLQSEGYNLGVSGYIRRR